MLFHQLCFYILDHRLTFLSVQVSLVCSFLKLNLDVIVAVRCAPHQSWTNLAECMSHLNLALQNVALERSPTSADFEKILSDCKSMGDIRDACSSNSSFKEAYSLSMKPVIELLKCRFSL